MYRAELAGSHGHLCAERRVRALVRTATVYTGRKSLRRRYRGYLGKFETVVVAREAISAEKRVVGAWDGRSRPVLVGDSHKPRLGVPT